VKRSL
jgi:hypothetical protein